MSYILEALKKADQEHGMGAVPHLATIHETRRPQTRSYRWLWIIVTLLSVNAVLVVMLLKDRAAEDAQVPVTAQVPLDGQTIPINDERLQPVGQSSEARMSEPSTPKQSVHRPVRPENEPILSTGELVVLPEPAYTRDSMSSILPEEESAMQMDGMTTANDNSQLRNWYELPKEFRNRLDLPRLDVHVYSEDPRKRFILVNLEKYREGETLASGLVLEEILPEGMVMSYQGERFRVEK